MVKRKRRAGCANCGCSTKGGYRYSNTKKNSKSRSAKGVTKRRRRKSRKKQTKRRRRRRR